MTSHALFRLMRNAAREDSRAIRSRRRRRSQAAPEPSRFRRPELEDRWARRRIRERRVGFHPRPRTYPLGVTVWLLGAGLIWALLGAGGVSLGGVVVAALLGLPLGLTVTYLDGRRALPAPARS